MSEAGRTPAASRVSARKGVSNAADVRMRRILTAGDVARLLQREVANAGESVLGEVDRYPAVFDQ
jgi:hypothetical protein